MANVYSVEDAMEYLEKFIENEYVTAPFCAAVRMLRWYVLETGPELRRLRKEMQAEVKVQVDAACVRERQLVQGSKNRIVDLEDRLDKIHAILNGEDY